MPVNDVTSLGNAGRRCGACSDESVGSLNWNRSAFRYEARFPFPYRCMVGQAIVRLGLECPEWGADKIGRLVRKGKFRVGNDRVRQVRRQEVMVVPQQFSF